MRLGFLLILIIGCITFQSFQCNKEVVKEDFGQSLYECHNKSGWDSISISKALIGKWTWKRTVCPRTKGGSSTDETTNSGVAFQFNTDGTLFEMLNNVKVKEYTYTINNNFGGYWGLETTPFRDLLYGRMLICNDIGQLDIGTSIVDGCDYRYKKMD